MEFSIFGSLCDLYIHEQKKNCLLLVMQQVFFFSLQEINVFLVALAPHMDFASYVHQYYKSGYLVYQESGEAGKVCADYMNRTVPQGEVGRVLDKLGQSMCNMLEYRNLKSIDIVEDSEEGNEVRYVDMIGPMSEKRSFIQVPCPSK